MNETREAELRSYTIRRPRYNNSTKRGQNESLGTNELVNQQRFTRIMLWVREIDYYGDGMGGIKESD